MKASASFVPVFIDTLKDSVNTKRFGEHFGSYPVLRIQDLSGKDIGGRLDTNKSAGQVDASLVVQQMQKSLRTFHP